MNNQEPSRRASNHSISVQSTSPLLCVRARAHGSQFPRPLLSLENHPKREDKEERDREKQKRGSARRRLKREWANAHNRRGTMRGPAIIVAFPTDKVTAPEYFLFSAADRARITRKES